MPPAAAAVPDAGTPQTAPSAAAVPESPAARPDSLRVHRRIAPAIEWKTVETRTFTWKRGRSWTLRVERGVGGFAARGAEERPLSQDRIVILSGKRTLGVLQHVDNVTVRVLTPEEAERAPFPPAVDDSLRPWPNACLLSLEPVPVPLDLNRNGRMEQPVRRFAPLPDLGGSGILFLEADARGRPRLVENSEFVRTVDFTEGLITSLRWDEGEKTPVLEAEYLPLYRCRFLARLGLRGGSECENCCRFPILLRADRAGFYRPFYERSTHLLTRDRVQHDLTEVAGGRPDEPLRPVEQASVAIAAAFFYFTGSWPEGREPLLRALGPRAELPSTRLFLARLDRAFAVRG